MRASSTGQTFETALALQRQGRLSEAEELYRSILKKDARHFSALHNLGYLRLLLGQSEDAERLMRKAVRIQPKSAEAQNTLGIILQSSGHFRQAAVYFKKALRLYPTHANAHNNLGGALHLLERHDNAINCYRRALDPNPHYAHAHRNLGNALQAVGQIDEARRAYEAAIAAAPRQTASYVGLSDCKRFTEGDPHLAAMEMLAREGDRLPEAERINLCFALAKALADIGQYSRSFALLLTGNALKRGTVSYDEAGTFREFEKTRAAFPASLIQSASLWGHPSELPVFVIGMPRSGTSLVEQIIASHPNAFGVGERADFGEAVRAVMTRRCGSSSVYPEGVATLSSREIGQIGARYIASVSRKAPSRAARIVNKFPLNFRFAGLISMALPNARIIHVRRHPLDTCLSCLSKIFSGDMPFSYDPKELARYYRAYEALMGHWREVLPSNTMLEMNYEELVRNPEVQSRELIEHCRLEWDAACLSFHTTRRTVLTASAAQVRQPIYHSSIGRWGAYGEVLRPLIDALAY